MNIENPEFLSVLEKATYNAENYTLYSPTQIARGEHLLNDPSIGEHAWSIPETTGRFLYSFVTEHGFKTGLEFGTSVGYSTLWIAAGLAHNAPDAHLITIERNGEKSEIAQTTLSPVFGDMITFHSGLINNYLQTVPDDTKFDFMFMDADRGNYMNYWPFIKSFMHKKSIVIIDNALRVQQSVREFQDFLKADSTLSTYLYEFDNGLFIVSLSDGDYSDLYNIFSREL